MKTFTTVISWTLHLTQKEGQQKEHENQNV